MLSWVLWFHIIVCCLRRRRARPEDQKLHPHLAPNHPLPIHHHVNNVCRNRTEDAAWRDMKRSWNKFGRAPRRGKSHATAVLLGEPSAAGSRPVAFRSEGRAITQARSISIKSFLRSAGNRAATMPLNSGANCVNKDSTANPAPFATGSKNTVDRKQVRRNNHLLPPLPRGHPRGKSHGCC